MATNLSNKLDSSLERSTKNSVLNDLYEDMYRNRHRVYRTNFIRGIFFGLGTFVGGTIVIALIILVLTWLMSIAPENFRDFFQWIVDTLSKK